MDFNLFYYHLTTFEKTILYCVLKNNMIEVVKKMLNKNVNIDSKSAILFKKKKLLYLIQKSYPSYS